MPKYDALPTCRRMLIPITTRATDQVTDSKGKTKRVNTVEYFDFDHQDLTLLEVGLQSSETVLAYGCMYAYMDGLGSCVLHCVKECNFVFATAIRSQSR